MDINIDKECSVLGRLFNEIITDMKNGAPLWEDLISKATKLHSCLRAAILGISAYLEAFQRIADCATNAKGATKEIGTALTRICLRHKAVETRMKSFTSAIMDCLVLPLQEKLEDWKKSLIHLDKEHTKEFKKARAELKKTSTDTLRLQKKKARKIQLEGPMQSHLNMTPSTEFNKLLKSSAAIIQEKRLSLEEIERKAIRAALIEERGRFCLFARFLKPILDEEIAMLMELTHIQEVSDQLQRHVTSPHQLPPASEQVISDIKGCDPAQWSLSTPPSSPSLSLGSRKSSVCSISSLTSSSSGSCKSHPSPSGHPWHKSLIQVPVFSQNNQNDVNAAIKTDTTSTWTENQESSHQSDDQNLKAKCERPHTISSAYEKEHQRPALSVYTFHAPNRDNNTYSSSQPVSPVSSTLLSCSSLNQQIAKKQFLKNNIGNKPPIPNRCSSLERPNNPNKKDSPGSPRAKAKLPLPAHLAKELPTHPFQQPMYVNMHVLANLAATRAQEMHLPLPTDPPNLATMSLTDEKTESKENDESCSSQSSTVTITGHGGQSVTQQSQTIHSQTKSTWSSSSCLVMRRDSKQLSSGIHPSSKRISSMIGESLSTFSSQSSDDCCVTTSEDAENLPPPPAFLLEGSSPNTSPTPKRSLSVSETVRTLTELRHTPASPSLLRKVTGQNVAAATSPHNSVLQITRTHFDRCSQDSSSSSVSSFTESSNETTGPGGVGQSFMAVLSAKFMNSAPVANDVSSISSSSSSPKSSKKHLSEQQSNKHTKHNSGFFESLNAKLLQQPQIINNRSANVRKIMGNRTPITDPLEVRVSLMDQIRKGTSLRKTRGPINDRSAPKIY